jgi:hypothetical protein
MPDLQNLDIGLTILVLAGLCAVGVVLLLLLQVLGTVFGFVFNILEVVGGVIQGGPMAWCGCLVGLLVCGGCGIGIAVTVSLLSSCGTPDAVNFCSLFGR